MIRRTRRNLQKTKGLEDLAGIDAGKMTLQEMRRWLDKIREQRDSERSAKLRHVTGSETITKSDWDEARRVLDQSRQLTGRKMKRQSQRCPPLPPRKVKSLKEIQKRMAGRLPQWAELEGKADKIAEAEAASR